MYMNSTQPLTLNLYRVNIREGFSSYFEELDAPSAEQAAAFVSANLLPAGARIVSTEQL